VRQSVEGLDKLNLGLGEWVVPTPLEPGSAEQIERLIWSSMEGGAAVVPVV
jgi:3-oxochol-4-en-24-oyl-CoA dehydrogenase